MLLARERHEQDVGVPQAAGDALWVRAQPRLKCGQRGGGDWDLALDITLAAHEEVMVRAVGARAPDRARRERTQLCVAQPAVAK